MVKAQLEAHDTLSHNVDMFDPSTKSQASLPHWKDTAKQGSRFIADGHAVPCRSPEENRVQ